MTTPRTLMTGISFGESPRWHDGRLWFSDWAGQQPHAVGLDGASEVVATIESFPFCIDFLPDGRLLVLHSAEQKAPPHGPTSLVTHSRPRRHLRVSVERASPPTRRGFAFLNNIGFDFAGGEHGPGFVAGGDPRRRRPGDGRGRPAVPQRHGGDPRRLDADRGRVLRQLPHGVRHRSGRGAVEPAGLGAASATTTPTASASMPRGRSGTPTSPTRPRAWSRAVRSSRPSSSSSRGVLVRGRRPRPAPALHGREPDPMNIGVGDPTGEIQVVDVEVPGLPRP